ncbi:MAG: hypothetical protein M1538_02450 [Candidatus Marsarchaeota archaeon]|jgi:hypothetical protein|nr:hypothetical protein [Candidatus Marsarchaeota archaeon]
MKQNRIKKNVKNKKEKVRYQKKNLINNTLQLHDAHVLLYNKEFHEAEYLNENCPMCGSRIDELGLCACDSAK